MSFIADIELHGRLQWLLPAAFGVMALWGVQIKTSGV